MTMFQPKTQLLVPPILVFLAKHPIVDRYDLSSLIYLQSGAAPLGEEVCEEVRRRLPNVRHICQGFGMTETSVASHFAYVGDRPDYRAAGTLGPNMEMKIVDVQSGRALPLGERGEVCVRGPNIMRGYLNRPEATRQTIDADGFLHTGDIGYLDQDGLLLYIVDRLKELIKVKGYQVAPAELEDLLLSHPQVADAAVIGVPDARTGERPKAFVVRKPGEQLSAEQLKAFVADKVAHYKQLSGGVEFVDSIPRSLAGKILRKELREREAAKKEAKL